MVLNNLSFLAALAGSKAGEADPLALVQEAADIVGPNSDILDTRAVVYISQKKYERAIRDLEMSVTDNPTASKYYHKALAHYLANDMSAGRSVGESRILRLKPRFAEPHGIRSVRRPKIQNRPGSQTIRYPSRQSA